MFNYVTNSGYKTIKTDIIAMLFMVVFLSADFFSQELNFTQYSVDRGLSQSVVKSVFQSKNGYIWFGTQQGLNRFTGYSFDKYFRNAADINSISDNWIYSISEDDDGNLWVATRVGLNKLFVKTGKFQRFQQSENSGSGLSSNLVYGLFKGKDGQILVNTSNALNIINPKNNSIQKYYYPFFLSNEVSDEGRQIIQTPEGKIWIATSNGLFVFNPESKKFDVLHNNKSRKLTSNNITALCSDNSGFIYAGTDSGLNRISINDYSIKKFYFPAGTSENTTQNFILSLILDSENNLWVGTNGSGLIKNYFDKDFNIKEKIVFTDKKENSNNQFGNELC